MDNKLNASKLVSEALLGIDGKSIIVADKVYFISPPTIKTICQAGRFLSFLGDEEKLLEMIDDGDKLVCACKALSCFIQGNEELYEQLMNGTFQDITDGLETALKLMDIRNFLRLSNLAKNVRETIAKQRS